MFINKLQLIAHRGIPRHYPENSLVGLEAAMRAAIPFVEFDLQSTADGELVLSHDISLRRTSGVDVSLFDLSWQQAQSIDVGQRKRFGDRFSGTRIPRLTDMVALAKRYPDCQLIVEIKPASLAHFGRTAIVDRLLAQLRPLLARCILISFDFHVLMSLRSEHPACRLGWAIARYGAAELEQARALDPDLIIASTLLLQPDTPLWPGSWQWMVYTINDPPLAHAYAMAGILLVETDDAERMARALAH